MFKDDDFLLSFDEFIHFSFDFTLNEVYISLHFLELLLFLEITFFLLLRQVGPKLDLFLFQSYSSLCFLCFFPGLQLPDYFVFQLAQLHPQSLVANFTNLTAPRMVRWQFRVLNIVLFCLFFNIVFNIESPFLEEIFWAKVFKVDEDTQTSYFFDWSIRLIDFVNRNKGIEDSSIAFIGLSERQIKYF